MLTRKFRELLEARYALRATVCVGLDSALYKIPNRFKPKGATARVIQFAFNEWIINQTCDLRLAAYKANFGFYLAAGPEGLWALHDTIQYSHMVAPSIPFILDAKVGDIDNTNEEYGTGLFGFFEADAITVHNYLGHETMEPFLSRSDKGIFVLCRTSNKGAGEFQDRVVKEAFTEEPLYCAVAMTVATQWNKQSNCGLVVGATYPKELSEVRALVGDNMSLLIPGIGSQGGDLEATIKAGRSRQGIGMIINSSRGIIFADNPRQAAEDMISEADRHLAA